MGLDGLLLAILLGFVQGVFEWLPISSEGNVALVLAALGSLPANAVRYALFLHLGTALAATGHYRETIAGLLRELPRWRSSASRDELTFLAVATDISGLVVVGSFLLVDLVNALAGGVFIALIGGLLVLNGVVQRIGTGSVGKEGRTPGLLDALLVGAGQGLAILPGVSRSGRP